MPLVKPCDAPGCGILTMGALCLEHERLDQRADGEPPAGDRPTAVAASLAPRAASERPS